MICRHEFFKPGSLACARCGEPGRYPSSAMSRHTRVGAADSQSERWIADRVRPDGARAKHIIRCPHAAENDGMHMCGFEPRMIGRILVRPTGVRVRVATREMRAGQ